MLDMTTKPPIGIHLLADHLDAALAAGEDLLALRLEPAADAPLGGTAQDRLETFVAALREHEAALLLRLLQARRRAEAVTTTDGALKSVLRLIAVGTASLVDLAHHYGQQRRVGLASGDDLQHVLRQRGLIAEDAAGVGPYQALQVEESFRVGGVAPLGVLLDMTAAALDLLDRQYNLYRDEDVAEADTGESAGPTELQAALDKVAASLVTAAGPEDVEAKATEASGTGAATADAATTEATDGAGVSPGSLRAALAEISPQN